jgi:hypothetical protein
MLPEKPPDVKLAITVWFFSAFIRLPRLTRTRNEVV